MYNKSLISIIIQIMQINMIIAGLLSSQNEANEIQYIAKIFTVKSRIRFIVRREEIKELLKREEKIPKQ